MRHDHEISTISHPSTTMKSSPHFRAMHHHHKFTTPLIHAIFYDFANHEQYCNLKEWLHMVRKTMAVASPCELVLLGTDTSKTYLLSRTLLLLFLL
jgi:hypothetical protein